MNIEKVVLEEVQLRKLMGAGSSEAVMLYLYLRSGNPLERAAEELPMTEHTIQCAAALLRQLGMYTENRPTFVAGERPAYSETDVLQAMNHDGEFKILYGEIQRILGKTLNTEELKILLGFNRYLGLPNEVISVLVGYCRERARQKGSVRNPSLRTIEKEAYFWAEQGIDTLEEAAAFIRTRNMRNSRIGKLKELLQIRGRALTPGEEKYADAWIEMGFDESALALAYERTCLNTGGLNWAYMNKILLRWKDAGYLTAEEVQKGDRKPAAPTPAGQRQLDADEIAAIKKMFQED